MNKTQFVEKLNSIWALSRQILVSDGYHSPQLFAFGADGRLTICAVVLDGGVKLRDVIPHVIERVGRVVAFVLVSEAWGVSASKEQGGINRDALPDSLEDAPGRDEILMAVGVTRDYQEMRTIVFEHRGKSIELGKEQIVGSDMPGAELRGAFTQMKELLEFVQ